MLPTRLRVQTYLLRHKCLRPVRDWSLITGGGGGGLQNGRRACEVLPLQKLEKGGGGGSGKGPNKLNLG